MARQRFVYVDGRGLVEIPPDWRPRPRLFHIVGDTTEPFYSHADGKHYSSKSRYRAECRAHGFEEVACSLESRLEAAREANRPKVPDLTSDEINRAASELGYEFG